MKEVITALIVDDEPNNVRALKLDLEDSGYEVITAKDGIEGWKIFEQNKDKIDVILLDRMMPNMDGMEFMKKLRESDDLSGTPVIMQTAAASKEQIVEGIEAGVYYYLTKPYDKDIMISVVSSAVADYGYYSKLRQDIRKFTRKLHLVKDARFEIRDLDDAQYLATFLSQFFPRPENVIFGISELLINAIEHGNLNITYEEKTELNKTNGWEAEVGRRIALPENKDKKAEVAYSRKDNIITLEIEDMGNGFNWKEYMEISPERATHNHGRGIALAKMMSFEKIEYIGNGNKVICKVVVS